MLCAMTLVLAALGALGVWPPGDRPQRRLFDTRGVMMELAFPDRPRGVYAFSGDFTLNDLGRPLAKSDSGVYVNEKATTPLRIRPAKDGIGVRLTPLSGAAELALGRKMNLCRANESDLMLLPGIGPVRARALAAYIRYAESIETLQDLEKAPGVGPETIRGLAPWARLDNCERPRETP